MKGSKLGDNNKDRNKKRISLKRRNLLGTKQCLVIPAILISEPNPNGVLLCAQDKLARDDDRGSKAGQTFLNFPVKTTTFAHLKNEVNRT